MQAVYSVQQYKRPFRACSLRTSWRAVTVTRESVANSRRRTVRDIVLYGLRGGVLIAVLKLTAYRFLVVEHSEIYGALIAAMFAALGNSWTLCV
jgi:hypothetical protein